MNERSSPAAEAARTSEPVAFRWRFEDQEYWHYRKERPDYADDRDIICEPLYLDAAQPSLTPTDEDWRRALDCAHSCFPLGKVTRAELDNALQHAFGMLSLSITSTQSEIGK